jgi:type II secretion system protein H
MVFPDSSSRFRPESRRRVAACGTALALGSGELSSCRAAILSAGLRGISPRNDGSVRGFTLIELMVVLVLIAIMTAVIIPEMRGTYEDALLRSNTRKLINVFNLAYSQAVSGSQLHRVRLDRKTGRYVIERIAREGETGRGFVRVRDVPGTEGELDTRITIDIQTPAAETSAAAEQEPTPNPGDAKPVESSRDVISFYPDGTADAKEILLKDRDGFRLALRINPTTARVRIVELERE